MKNKLVFGIDLGTTNSAIGYVTDGGKLETITLYDEVYAENDYAKKNPKKFPSKTLPSCVMFHRGRFIVGREAYNHKDLRESETRGKVCYSIKSHMEDPYFRFTFSDSNEEIEMSPAEISAEILKALVAKADPAFGKVEDVVITVPAYFPDPAVSATKEAARLAGLNCLKITREPTAAATTIDISQMVTKTKKVVCYDLGGGTFDTVGLQIMLTGNQAEQKNLLFSTVWSDEQDTVDSVSDKEVITIIATDGNNHLGGDDLDKYLLDMVVKRFCQEVGTTPDQLTAQFLENTKHSIEGYKKQGSFYNKNNSIDLMLSTTLKDHRAVKASVRINHTDFRVATNWLYQQTCNTLHSVIEKMGDGIDTILLVGGSTKNEILRELIVEDFPGVHVDYSLNPDESIAYGAGKQAKLLVYKDETFSIFDALAIGIGIKTKDGIESVIPQNTQIPTVVKRVYATVQDNQTEMRIAVYQGNSRFANECIYLGEIVIKDIRPAKVGEVPLLVTFSIDTDSMLVIHAEVDGIERELKLTLGADVETDQSAEQPATDLTKAQQRMIVRWENALRIVKVSEKDEVSSRAEELEGLIKQVQYDFTDENAKKVKDLVKELLEIENS